MKYKHLFFNDYSEGAHPRILEALTRGNLQPELGYGADSFSINAAEQIRTICQAPDAEVHFVSGGTQANLIVCSAFLKPYESVIAADSGHISIHETGAIEATGHKVHAVKHKDGKLTPGLIEDVVKIHSDEHMVKPRMVFVSQATELGTVYSKLELTEISEICRAKGLLLYLDGARLGAACVSEKSDLSLADIARLTDLFYIGGTKNGLLFGEAIVISSSLIHGDFRFYLKQNGGLLAKGRVLGVQFSELFRDGFFFDLAKSAHNSARRLADGIEQKGYQFEAPVETNQIFARFPNSLIEKLQRQFGFYVWSPIDSEQSVVRLVTSWATTDAAIDEFLSCI